MARTDAKTDPAADFRDSPRYAQIKSVFDLIETDATKYDVWGAANKVTQSLNAEERNRLQELVELALKSR
jgi:hypothetical protein